MDIHKNCLHTTQPHMTPKERADKCGCIRMIAAATTTTYSPVLPYENFN